MSLPVPDTLVQLMGRPLILPGFHYSLRYPAILFGVISNMAEVPDTLIGQGSTFLVKALQLAGLNQYLPADPDQSPRLQDLPAALLRWMEHLQRAAGLPIFEGGRIVRADGGRLLVCIPTMARGQQATIEAFIWLLELLNLLSAGKDVALHLDALSGRITALKEASPFISNVPRFLRAAYEIGVPFQELPGQVFQYGYGARARWLDSSLTDETPAIGAKLARSKIWAASMLRRAGIPTPQQVMVDSEEIAVNVSKILQYPVVVKPADQDGGVGVAAGLTTAAEVREAFVAAQQYSKNILVEKHFAGKDYRLTVFQDKVIWAIERIPGGVTGDGSSTVQQLVDQLNEDPRRGEGAHAPLKRLVLNNEAQALLRRAGLKESSVPKAGEFVRLRRTSNVANGGMPVAVMDQVHPDNRLLAVRAAAALHLDLAGIDLLIPDISRSWQEVGAVICEVNAQPNLGQTTAAHLYQLILRQLIPGDGRIPIVVVLGAAPENTLSSNISGQLKSEGLVVGRADQTGVESAAVLNGPVSTYAGGQILLSDQSVGAVVIGIHDTSILQTGLPFDRFDVLVVAGTHLKHHSNSGGPLKEGVLHEMLNILLMVCEREVITVMGSGVEVPSSLRPDGTAQVRTSVPPEQAAEAAVNSLLAAERKHRAGF